jgi:hypothetical protein
MQKPNSYELGFFLVCSALRRVAIIQSIGLSARIEGSKLTDREVAQWLPIVERATVGQHFSKYPVGYLQRFHRRVSCPHFLNLN